MKKTVLALSVFAFMMSCQKPAEGGNHARIKMSSSVERYDDDHQGASHQAEEHAATAEVAETPKSDSVKVTTETKEEAKVEAPAATK